jgi:hypothetical protein
MAREKRSDVQLRAASDHLFYEIQMLMGVAGVLGTGALGQSIVANALLESFTVHLRALLDFFYAENPYPTDVVAEDFFATPGQWTSMRASISLVLSKARGRVNKEVAHLTYDRQLVPADNKPWEFPKLAAEIGALVDLFLANVDKRLLGARWDGVSGSAAPTGTAGMVGATTNISTPGTA